MTGPGVAGPLESASSALAIRLRSLGDCVLLTPTVRALKSAYPRIALSVLVERPFADVFRDSPHIFETIVLEKPRSRFGLLRQRVATAARVRRKAFDVVMNFHGGSTSRFFTAVSGSPVKAGFAATRRERVYTHPVRNPEAFFGNGPLHTVQHQMAIPIALGMAVPQPIPHAEVFVPGGAERERVRLMLEAESFPVAGYIHVHPTATLASKQWPPEFFAELVGALQNRFGARVLLTCGPSEARVVEEIRSALAPRPPAFSRLTLPELAAAIEGSAAFVGCDSGPAHLAAAMGKPVCVIFGSSNHNAWHPWGTHCRVVRLPFHCSPCPGYVCKEFDAPRCIREVAPSNVLDALNDLLVHTAADCAGGACGA